MRVSLFAATMRAEWRWSAPACSARQQTQRRASSDDHRRAILVHAVARSGSRRAKKSSCGSQSDDTAHGFRILGHRHERRVPKRGQGEVSRARPSDQPGRYDVRVHARVRRRPQFHARRRSSSRPQPARKRRMTRVGACGGGRLRRSCWSVALVGAGPGRSLAPGRSAARHLAGRVRRVPPRPRRFHSKSKPPRKGSDRRSTAPVAPRATTCRPLAAAASIARDARRLPRRGGRVPRAQRRRRHADPHVLDAQPRLPGASCRTTRTSSPAARRSRCSARDWSKPSPTRRSWRSRIRSIAIGDGVSGRAAIVIDVGDRRAPRRPVRLEGAARDAARVRRATPTATRWASPTICSREESAFGVTPSADAPLRSDSRIPKTSATRSPRRRGIDNFEAFMKFLAPLARGAIDDAARERRTGLRRHRLRGVPRAVADDRRRARHPRLQPQAGAAVFRPAAARCRHRRRHPPGPGEPDEIRTPALWGLRFRRPLLHDGSAPTIEAAILRHAVEAEAARQRFQMLPAASREALLAFLRSL